MKLTNSYYTEDTDFDVSKKNPLQSQLDTLAYLREYRLTKKERELRKITQDYLNAEKSIEKAKYEFIETQSIVQQARIELTNHYTNTELTLDDMRQWNIQECDLGNQLMLQAEKYQKQEINYQEQQKLLEVCRKQRQQADIAVQRLDFLYQELLSPDGEI